MSRRPSQLATGAVYCSRSCHGVAQRRTKTCPVCGETYNTFELLQRHIAAMCHEEAESSEDDGSDYEYVWDDVAYVKGWEAECAAYDYNYADTDSRMVFLLGGAGLPDSADL